MCTTPLPTSSTIQFSEDVSATLSLTDIAVENLTTSSTFNPTLLSYNSSTQVATFSFPAGAIPDGSYRATLIASGITDLAGNALDGDGDGTPGGDWTLDFFFLQGDANHDRKVNVLDFGILATNFGTTGKIFSQGDFNYDGKVNVLDFGILASRFGTILAPDGSIQNTGERLPVLKLPFGTSAIVDRGYEDNALVATMGI